MNNNDKKPIISTIKEKCRFCYTCIRECPAKAISITSGQAEVIESRCIHCGNCLKVCSQKAKKIISSIDKVQELINSTDRVAAIIAPSFPAEFVTLDPKRFVSVLRELGFDFVCEVGFGADLVAKEYKKLMSEDNANTYIATTCPAVVSYVEKYFPNLIPKLAPIVSPMIATARVLRKMYGDDLKVVFIGPCIAKKSEKLRKDIKGEVNAVLTFGELKDYIYSKKLFIFNLDKSEFDDPLAGEGSLFSVSNGLLQAADIREDYINENVISANGTVNFLEAIKEFNRGYLNSKLLETLSCEGCILGPGVTNDSPLYERRHLVSHYVKSKIKNFDRKRWEGFVEEFKDLDLSCKFKSDNQNISLPSDNLLNETLVKLGKVEKDDELNCGACGYQTCKEHAIAVLNGFAENEMCLPYTIEKLRNTVTDLEKSYIEVKSIRETLAHREKLASMGQLSAGIAHELNNPLGVILMYAHTILDDADGNGELKEDLQVIANHADRCKKIVSSLLNFSRQNKIIKNEVNLVDLCKYCLDSIHTPEAISVSIEAEFNNIIAEIDKDQISQVIINLINNSIDAMEEKGGEIKLLIGSDNFNVFLIVKDNGPGIPKKYHNKVFDPFFTTKQIGKGTGLGLSVSYGIVKMHSGTIDIESNTDEKLGHTGTSIKVSLPLKGQKTF